MAAGSLLETTQNTRDLGGHKTVDGKVTIANRIYRSDRQEYPSERDIRFLLENGITTIIDLRIEDDVLEKPSGFQNREGFYYHNIPIVEGSDIPESVEAVPKSYMAIATLEENMPKLWETMANAPAGVMFNCSAGKDRSGTVTVILLMLCGVVEEEIVADYMLTKENNLERFELIRQNHPEIDMNIVIPRESFIQDFMKLFKERFGNVDGYFKYLGINDIIKTKLYKKMMEG
jgi:hypothetical protein